MINLENSKEVEGLGAAYKIAPEGLALEFGVASGDTIELLAHTKPNQKIYGFDSFEGLPEAWFDGYAAGHFACDIPTVPENVVLIKGWFDDTLPKFLEEHKEPISFIHIDCDLYSSTKTILDNVKNRLAHNCVIAFDELLDYGNQQWRLHEYKAFEEFLEETKYNYKCLGKYETHKAAFTLWR